MPLADWHFPETNGTSNRFHPEQVKPVDNGYQATDTLWSWTESLWTGRCVWGHLENESVLRTKRPGRWRRELQQALSVVDLTARKNFPPLVLPSAAAAGKGPRKQQGTDRLPDGLLLGHLRSSLDSPSDQSWDFEVVDTAPHPSRARGP